MQDITYETFAELKSTDYRLSSTRAIVNLINLVLQTDDQMDDLLPKTSILLKDPYPEHVSNGLSRAASSLLRLYKHKSLNGNTVEAMSAAVFTGLEILTQVSYSASNSLGDLRGQYDAVQLKYKSRQRLPSACSIPSPIVPESFQDEIVNGLENQAIADPALVNKSIERHEKLEDMSMSMYIPDDIPWMMDALSGQEWAFNVSQEYT